MSSSGLRRYYVTTTMQDFLIAIILGVVEGVTEFLPISSTGHLILFNEWFAFEESFTKMFNIVIQSGAILAVIIIFWKDLWPEKLNFKAIEAKWGKIFVAFVVTAILGVLLSDYIEEYLFSPWVVAIALIVYGIAFYFIETARKKLPDLKNEIQDSISYNHAVLIGLAQSLAMIPGTSRSGATIVGLLLLGYSRVLAVKFSFLLAVPTLLAAGGYSLLKYDRGLSVQDFWLLAVGFIVSFVTAYAVSKWFLGFIRTNTFIPFAYYRIVLGLLVLAYFGYKMM